MWKKKTKLSVQYLKNDLMPANYLTSEIVLVELTFEVKLYPQVCVTLKDFFQLQWLHRW